MPEMRAETIREARRKGVGATEDVTDPYDLTSLSRPIGPASTAPVARDGNRERGPHAVTARAERLRSGRHLERGESGGPG
jgi:hypothetical protein